MVNKTPPFSFQLNLSLTRSNKMHEATFKLVLTHIDNMLIANIELLLQIIDGLWVIFKR